MVMDRNKSDSASNIISHDVGLHVQGRRQGVWLIEHVECSE